MVVRLALFALLTGLFLLPPSVVEARITRIVLDRVESPTFGGESFGAVGQFEKLVGVAYGEVDPGHPLNQARTSSWRRSTRGGWWNTPPTSTSSSRST
jgi:hypothetical protein